MSKSKKTAIITGITGQDGSYLAELLLSKGYTVHGINRRTSSFNTARIDHLIQDNSIYNKDLFLHHGEMIDASNLGSLIQKIRPDEVYNLAAQSHVLVSFEQPEYTANVVAMGTLRLLEAIRAAGLIEHTRFYQASTSELYGDVRESPQTELTQFYPRSPYAVAKLYAHWAVINYREAYGMFACNGILFNHESPRRGITFVTRKITHSLTRIYLGLDEQMELGNLDALRDWGHARDYVHAQWNIMQQNQPDDYVIATGIQRSVRNFFEETAKCLGMHIRWHGEGKNEVCLWTNRGNGLEDKIIAKVSERLYRPAEVETLLGDASKAKKHFGWVANTSFSDLVAEMTEADLKLASLEKQRI